MNFRTTIVLLILVIISGWYLFDFEKDKPASKVSTQIGTESPLLSDSVFDADAIEHISIEHDNKTIVIEKNGVDWMQTKPVKFGVNTWSANQFATTAAGLKTTGMTADESSLSEIGLDPPLAVLTLKDGDQTHTFKIGRKLTIGSRGYLMINDDPQVHIVNDELHNMVLDGDVKEWRKKSLTGVKEGKAKRVVLTRNGQTIELIKNQGAWALGGSHSGRVATNAVEELLGKLDGLLVREFAVDQPDDLAVYGLTSPQTTLRIEPASATSQPAASQPAAAKTVTFSIGAPTDLKQEKFYATLTHDGKSANVVFIIAKSDKEKFTTQPDDLRDKQVSLVNAADVNTIEVKQGNTSFKMERSDSSWTFAEPAPPFTPDGGVIGEVLDSVEVLEAESFVANAKPQTVVIVTATITASGRVEPDILTIYAHDGDNYLVMRNNETTGRVVPARKLTMLTKPVLAWRYRTVIDVKTDELTSVTLTRPDGLKLEFTKPGEGAWQLAGHDKFETADFEALLIHIQPLMAQQWLETGKVGDKAYHIQIGDKTALSIDADSRIATASGIEGVFEVSPGMISALGIEMRFRTVFDFSADDIKQVAVDDMTITRKDGNYTSEQTDKLDSSAAGGLFDTIAGLRIERYITAPVDVPVMRTVTITMGDGSSHTLQLIGDKRAAVGDKWFELSQEDDDKLTAKLISEE